jgi:hypothetical protein
MDKRLKHTVRHAAAVESFFIHTYIKGDKNADDAGVRWW